MKPGLRSILLFAAALLALVAGLTHAAEPALPHFYAYSDKLSSAGQPSQSQFAEIELAGYAVVINLAPPNYKGAIAAERQTVEGARMQYVYIPVSWDAPALKDFAQFVEVMDRLKDKKILVHCQLNSRASVFDYLYRTLREGLPEPVEMDVMVQLWNANRGYELKNMPQWRSFLEQARVQFKK